MEKTHVKCVPYGFTFRSAAPMVCLMGTVVRPADMTRPGAEIVPGDSGTVDIVVKPDPAYRSMLTGAVEEFDRDMRLPPGSPARNKSPRSKYHHQVFRNLLERGMCNRIDIQTGLEVSIESTEGQFRWRNFQWLDQPNAADFAVPGDWEDRTAGPSRADPADLAMMDVDQDWDQLGEPDWFESDSRFVNVKTGESWRVPFPGCGSETGSLFNGGAGALFCGKDLDNGGSRLYVYMLEKKLVAAVPKWALVGKISGPIRSPDGKTVALLHDRATEGIDVREVVFVDTHSSQTTMPGPTGHFSPPSWLPDSSAVVVAYRPTPAPGKKVPWSVVKLDQQGQVTTLCTGDTPAVLTVEQRILFSVGEGSDRKWLTCDLAGQGVRQFGDGFAGYEQPSVSHDGKRLLMMSPAGKGARQVPVVIDIADFSIHPVPIGDGVWAHPVW